MIATCGDDVAWLGGRRGDRLCLSIAGAPFRHVADLGWDTARQSTPQRRMVLTGDALFVLEPQEGPFLLPPLRVRRFHLDGREQPPETKPTDGDAFLYFHLEPQTSPSYSFLRCGLDPENGRPLSQAGSLDLALRWPNLSLSGTPLFAGGVWWYPVRMVGLVRDGALLRGEPAAAQDVRGVCVCPGVGGLWIDGRWTRVRRMGRVFRRWRPPLGQSAAPVGDRGIVVLRPGGGSLPVLDGPAASLPAGTYSDIVARAGGVFAVSTGNEGDQPGWVPVRF